MRPGTLQTDTNPKETKTKTKTKYKIGPDQEFQTEVSFIGGLIGIQKPHIFEVYNLIDMSVHLKSIQFDSYSYTPKIIIKTIPLCNPHSCPLP